jgi:hypothetical protein
MAVIQVSSAPSREQYESVSKRLDLESDKPAGLILHGASELPSGEIQIVDVWESRDALQAFAQQRLFPAFADAEMMGTVQDNEPPTPYDVIELVRG